MQIFTAKNNKDLYEIIKNLIQKELEKNDFIILRDSIRILTRETVSAEYLSMKLVKDGIPALCFDTQRWVDFLSKLKQEYLDSDKWKVLNDFYCENIIYSIIENNKKLGIKNTKGLRQLARDIFSEHEEQLVRGNSLQPKYQEILSEFRKRKKSYLTPIEVLKKLSEEDFSKNKFIKKDIKSPIHIFGLQILDPIHFEILRKVSAFMPVNFYICEPYETFFKASEEKMNRDHILLKGIDKKGSSRQEQDVLGDTKLFFYEAPEVHREVEFVGRHILGKIAESSDQNLHLTRIKVIIPDEPSYAISLKNCFLKMGIPFAFTNEIYTKRQTAYYNAILSLIRLTKSNFEKTIALNLFQNPCFHPSFPLDENPKITVKHKVKPDVWVSLFNQLDLYGFLDSEHRKSEGLSEDDSGTWDRFWQRALLSSQGEMTGENILTEEVREEIPNMVRITYSLFQDLLFFRESNFTPKEFVDFFSTLLEVYLDFNLVPDSEEQKTQDYHKRIQEMIYKSVVVICSKLLQTHIDDKYPTDVYLDFLLEGLSKLTDGSGRILRYGVVVGSFVDTSDLIFDYVYVLGMDEKRVPSRVIPREYLSTLEYSKKQAYQIYIYSKESFYSILNYCAKEIHLSYVNRDSIGDKPIYPSRELLALQESVKSKGLNHEFASIPLFSYLEPNAKMFKSLAIEKEAIQMIWLKQLENEYQIDKIFPDWEEKNKIPKIKAQKAWEDLGWKEKLSDLHYIPKLVYDVEPLPEEVGLYKFIQYLECPRKYFYTNYLRLKEEEDPDTNYRSLDSLQKYNLVKKFCNTFFEVNERRLEDIVQVIREEGFASDFFARGLLGQVEWRRWQEYFQSIDSGLREQKWEKAVIGPKFRGKEDLGEFVFQGGEILGQKIFFQTDFLLSRGNEFYLTKFIFSDEIKWKPKVELYLQWQSLKGKSLNIKPQILQVGKNFTIHWKDFPSWSNAGMNAFLKKRWDQFTSHGESPFEAEPMERPASFHGGTCEYCRFQKICPGFNRSYENDSVFLENKEWKENFLKD